MSCETFERMVSARLAEDLPEADERLLEAHLDGCEACAGDASLAEEAVRAARLPEPTLEERAAISRLRDPIAMEFRLSHERRRGLGGGALRWSIPWVGAAIAAGLVLTLSLRHPPPRPVVSSEDSDELVAWALNDPSAELLAPGDPGSSVDDDLSNALSDDGSDVGILSLDDDGATP